MDKREYLKLTLEQQVNYINKEMEDGKGLNAICKKISVDKGATLARLKKNNYKLIESQYILKQIPEKQNLKGCAKELQLDGVAVELNDGKELLEGTNIVQKNETTINQSNEVGNISNKIETVVKMLWCHRFWHNRAICI